VFDFRFAQCELLVVAEELSVVEENQRLERSRVELIQIAPGLIDVDE
jgi:hypothetical protein